ncbi:MAG: AAC(3) family N-acetyltransferase [Kiritimatiellae bacterium]|nr:AAC(3) family N-acetyltransferase [Kiritimatiellia bacterium]
MTETTISQESIRKSLDALGIQKGDKIVLHSDLQSLGKARELVKLPNCGADCILDAVLEQIGNDGLLCLPVFTKTFVQPSAGPCKDVFDPDTTPSRVGSITNIFLKRPGTVRSLHPTHSWAATGKNAAEFVEGHDQTTTFGRDSLCGRMYDWDFRILWFGTTGTTNTSTHFAEDWLDLPYMASEDALVKDGDEFKKVTVYRAPSGPRDFYKRAGCKLDEQLKEWNIQTTGQAHGSKLTLMQHRTFMNHMLHAMIADPCLLLADDKEDAYHKRFYELHPIHIEQLKAKHGGEKGILSSLNCSE